MLPENESFQDIVPGNQSFQAIVPANESLKDIVPDSKSFQTMLLVNKSLQDIVPGNQSFQAIVPGLAGTEASWPQFLGLQELRPAGFSFLGLQELRPVGLSSWDCRNWGQLASVPGITVCFWNLSLGSKSKLILHGLSVWIKLSSFSP